MFRVINEQVAVFHSKSRRVLLVAGPGTGKTKVISCCAIKQANILAQHGISWADTNAKVLVVSLTNYVAEKVQKEIEILIEDENVNREIGPIRDKQDVLDRIVCSTFHSFSFRMLIHFSSFNTKRYTVIDNEVNEEHLLAIVEQIKPEWKNDKKIIRSLLDVNRRFRKGKGIKKALVKKYPKLKHHSKIIIQILKQLEQRKRAKNLITFDDMVIGFNKLLKDKNIRDQVIKMYPFLLVDEFQDTTGLQYKVLRKIVGPSSYLFCAGDDGQTIYTWNGASFNRFKYFQKHFPQSKTYQLTINHRSRRWLTDLSNFLIAQSEFATKKKARAVRDGKKARVICNKNPIDNYNFIIEKVQELVKKGKSYNDIAVIYRFYNDVYFFKSYFVQSKIPFKVLRDKSKRDRPIIKIIFALIRIIETDSIRKNDWWQVLMYTEGVWYRRADEIINWLKTKETNDIVYPKEYKFTPHLKKLIKFVNSMKNRELSNTEKLDRLFEYVYKLNKVNKSFNEHIKPTLFKYANESKSLSDIINKYNNRSYPLYYPVEEKPPFSDYYVTLSTIHGIKGGEFHTVFYLGASDELYIKSGSFFTDYV